MFPVFVWYLYLLRPYIVGSTSQPTWHTKLLLLNLPVFLVYLFSWLLCLFYRIKKPPIWRQIRFLYRSRFNSGDDLLFRGLSQSTIGDTEFPCLVRDGTEGDFRSIITRINPAPAHQSGARRREHHNILFPRICQRSLQAFCLNKSNKG